MEFQVFAHGAEFLPTVSKISVPTQADMLAYMPPDTVFSGLEAIITTGPSQGFVYLALRESSAPLHGDEVLPLLGGGRWLLISRAGALPISSGTAILTWGTQTLTGTSTTRYLTPGYEGSSAPTVQIDLDMPRAAVLSSLRVRARLPGANAAPTLSFGVLVNGVPTPLVATGPSNVTGWTDLVHTLPVVAGDRVALIVTKSAAGNSPTDVIATLSAA
jgi:hypothetical protein